MQNPGAITIIINAHFETLFRKTKIAKTQTEAVTMTSIINVHCNTLNTQYPYQWLQCHKGWKTTMTFICEWYTDKQ